MGAVEEGEEVEDKLVGLAPVDAVSLVLFVVENAEGCRGGLGFWGLGHLDFG